MSIPIDPSDQTEANISLLMQHELLFMNWISDNLFIVSFLTQLYQVPAVQGLPEEDSGRHKPVWPWNGHRARQHRLQLRHARGHRHLPAQSC